MAANQIVIPKSFERLIIEENHDKFGHLGTKKCLTRI